ncbi:collagen-like protein [Mucilaginibacter sp. OK098]|uniref:collagen-like protein n=1 Tax=Mucilaginibacter sp. OK098 TaxID=1855297 RepID=UPI0013562B62|nr:collagen-like protein [Mucilaginibacter sp. OK098]
MKTRRYLSLLSIICLSLLLVKCGKDGAIGPQGNAGDKGPVGAVGPAGPAGANGIAGSVIYSGNTAPAADKGNAGDFYLNTATGLLYGPKTTAGWGTGFSLKGPAGTTGATGATGAAGATGTTGSTTLSGAGLPASSLGNNGDYYLDKTNYLLYGPKTASEWGIPINLQGPAGPQGPEGNANVKTDVFTVSTGAWVYSDPFFVGIAPGASARQPSIHYDRANALITTDLLNTGMILVYFQSTPMYSEIEWQPLPFYFIPGGTGDYTYNWAYITSVGNVRLEFYFTALNSTPPDVASYSLPTTKYKVITVSGTLLGSIHQNHINLNNYNEVSRFLGVR